MRLVTSLVHRGVAAVILLLAYGCDGGSREQGSTSASTVGGGFPVSAALAWMSDSMLLVSVLQLTGGGHVWAADCQLSGLFSLGPGGNMQLLEQGAELCAVLSSGDLAVSQTGRFIAFRSTRTIDDREIRIFDRRFRRSRPLVHPCAAEFAQPSWMASGDTVVVIGGCTGADSVLYFDTEGRFRRGFELGEFTGEVTGLAVSEIASLIAIQSASPSGPIISVAPLRARQPVSIAGAGAFPAWQPRGRLLAAIDRQPEGANLSFWDVAQETSSADSRVRPYLTVKLPGPHVLPPMLWSQDGARLVFSVGTAILHFEVSSRRLDTLLVIGGDARDGGNKR